MSFRSTAILILILAVLGGGVYFLEYRPNPEPSGLDPKLQIWKLDKDTIQRVVARSAEGEQIMEKRSDVPTTGGSPARSCGSPTCAAAAA